jgi:predicted amidohydrolase
VRIVLAQLDGELGAVRANADRARAAAAEAGAGGADLVVFPELYLSGYALGEIAHETAYTAADTSALVALEPDAPAMLLGFHERCGDQTYNSAAYFEHGRVLHVHRKLHLVDYTPFDEDRLYAPGHELRAFTSAAGRVATLICNDCWHPALPFLAVQDGAAVLLVPSCSSTELSNADDYWTALTRFYARMLQCYVVFVNRVGVEGPFTFWGGSHVVDPRGEIVAAAPHSEEAITVADIDLRLVAEERARLPLTRRPRFELIRTELDRLARSRPIEKDLDRW